jgi:hypothetical protein
MARNSQRQLAKEFRKPIRAFAAPAGQVVWASNYCHSALHGLFCTIVDQANLDMGNAIWHSQQSDKHQRDMLLAAAEVALAKNKPALRCVRWAINRANALATKRNDAVHMAPIFQSTGSGFEISVNPIATAPRRSERLAKQNLKRMFRMLTGDFVALANFVRHVDALLVLPEHYTLPRRPRLLSIPPVGKKKKSRR